MQKEQIGRIIEIIQRTPNVKSFRLSVKEEANFKAGQFLSAAIGEGKDFIRYLSISSSPTEKSYIEFTKKLTDSKFSRKLDSLKVGDMIKIKYPLGNFILECQNLKLAFLSGGIGITPIRSIFRYICDFEINTNIVLIYGNRSLEDIVFKEEFDKIQRKCSAFRIVHVLSNPPDGWDGRIGHIDRHVIEEEIPDYGERKFYICGPPRMVTEIKWVLTEELKVGKENIVTENFTGY